MYCPPNVTWGGTRWPKGPSRLPKATSPLQELEVGARRAPYLLVIYTRRYNSLQLPTSSSWGGLHYMDPGNYVNCYIKAPNLSWSSFPSLPLHHVFLQCCHAACASSHWVAMSMEYWSLHPYSYQNSANTAIRTAIHTVWSLQAIQCGIRSYTVIYSYPKATSPPQELEVGALRAPYLLVLYTRRYGSQQLPTSSSWGGLHYTDPGNYVHCHILYTSRYGSLRLPTSSSCGRLVALWALLRFRFLEAFWALLNPYLFECS